jgi:HD-GYP domain-containing protein (c-di-GMP phosphodiesterase class II)
MKLPDQQVNLVHLAGLLHDIGKIGVPDNLLKSASHLEAADWALLESHCSHGHRILGRVEQFQQLADVVLCHHERYDGSGYPQGLLGEDIPVESRIISVSDAYSAMTSRRPYGPPLAPAHAEAELEFNKGGQFDPAVVDCFLRVLRKGDEAYRLGLKADFRMEMHDVKFLRDLPVEPEGGEEVAAPPARVAKVKDAQAPSHTGETAMDVRRKAQERTGKSI